MHRGVLSDHILLRLRGDQRIQGIVRGYTVHEGDDVPAAEDQAVARGRVGHGGQLLRGYAQQVGQRVPGVGRLVEQDQQLGVGQHGLGTVALEHIVHILGDARVAGVVFPGPLPLSKQELGTVFAHEQQIELVDEHIGEPLLGCVLQDAVVDGIQDHQHAYRFQGTAQVPDVVTDQGVFRIHVGGLGEDIQQTLRIQLYLQGQVLCVLLRLLPQAPVEVLQSGGWSLRTAVDIVREHHCDGTGDD